MRDLNMEEIEVVSGGIAPWLVHLGVGAGMGALGSIGVQINGDGLGWDDWDEILIGAGLGAAGGALNKLRLDYG